MTTKRRICFVTGTRAEFGLMARTLDAIASRPDLSLSVVATGMHLDRSRGYTVAEVRRSRWGLAATVAWQPSPDANGTAAATGRALAGLAAVYERLQSDVVLVVGDRVEAFAAASAAHIAGRCVAHVHGGDRALGLVDDALRHAITKLAHVHFPATRASADRLIRLGEDRWRVHRVGSPGLDGIIADAADSAEVAEAVGRPPPYVLTSLHPAGGDDAAERRRARLLMDAVVSAGTGTPVVVYPNNDPGSAGIVDWLDRLQEARTRKPVAFFRHLPRRLWLGLVRDAAILVGNSSSGIIEAASFGTPVLDIGPRQQGRERGPNVTHVDYDGPAIAKVLRQIGKAGRSARFPRRNLYGDGKAGPRIADHLSRLQPDSRLYRKLIAY